MTIGTKTCPRRCDPGVAGNLRRGSVGVSASGAVSSVDFARKISDIELVFRAWCLNDESSIDGWSEVETYLEDTIKYGGSVSVTPDYMNPPTNTIYDDLGVGATGAVTLYYLGFEKTWVAGYYWDVILRFKYVA